MDAKQATLIFEALSSEVRLELFRLLVRNAPEGLVAGEIARLLDIPSTNLSFHLKALLHSELVNVEREGRFQRYRANIPLMLSTIGYLTEECCQKNPAQCKKYRKQSGLQLELFPVDKKE